MCCDKGKCVFYTKSLCENMMFTAKRQCWMLPTVLVLLAGTGFSFAAVFTKFWIHITCQENASFSIGLLETCMKNHTSIENIISCKLSEDYTDWLVSVEFLMYTSLILVVLTTCITSLLLCTPPNGKTAGLAMGVAGIAFVPAMLQIFAVMSVVAVETRTTTLTNILHIIERTFHYTCTPGEHPNDVTTGDSLVYCAVASVFTLCGAMWSFVLSCIMKTTFKGKDLENERSVATKMGWRGAIQGRDDNIQWNEDFFKESTKTPEFRRSRRNSSMVNDSIVSIFS